MDNDGKKNGEKVRKMAKGLVRKKGKDGKKNGENM